MNNAERKAFYAHCRAVAAAKEALELAEKVQANRRPIREGAISAVLSDDEIVEGVRRGWISNDDAMNRDF